MEIVHVKTENAGTAAKRLRATSAGLASAYQRTGYAAQGASAIATTAGEFVIELLVFPTYAPVEEMTFDLHADRSSVHESVSALGYRAMADLNKALAEESLPAAVESWPRW